MVDSPGRLLVVDDDPTNRELLSDLLESQGHEILMAEDGPEALEMVAKHDPDCVLLDVMMPGMTGFEVCAKLRENPETANLPVILVTALTDRANRLKGIEAGANDFLTKPLDLAETGLRVRNAIRSRRLFGILAQRNEELHQLGILRDNLTNMLIHDLKSPLAAIMGYIKLVQTTAAPRLQDREKEFLQRSALSGQRMLEMVTSLLDVSRLETGDLTARMERVDLGALVGQVIDTMPGGEITTQWTPPAEPAFVECDAELVRRVLTNLLDNAAKYARKRIVIQVEGGKVSVADDGRGIPPEYHQRVFEKFGQVDGGTRYSTGLGLTFCKLAVEAQGGRIGLESVVGTGSTFWFTLPEA